MPPASNFPATLFRSQSVKRVNLGYLRGGGSGGKAGSIRFLPTALYTSMSAPPRTTARPRLLHGREAQRNQTPETHPFPVKDEPPNTTPKTTLSIPGLHNVLPIEYLFAHHTETILPILIL
jgi:hypothetical protein